MASQDRPLVFKTTHCPSCCVVLNQKTVLHLTLGRIDEDLVTDPPEIILDLNTVILNGCPAEVKKKLKEPKVISAPLCSGRGPIKLSFVDEIYEKNCVQYIERMWLVKDGCGNLANTTQQIRIKRPEMSVTFPDDVRGKCHLGEVIVIMGREGRGV